MSDITQGNQYYTKIQEAGGKNTITSLAKEDVLPLTYQVLRGRLYPRTEGTYQVLNIKDDTPIRVYEGQQIIQLSGNGLNLAGGTSLQLGLAVDATGAVGATGALGGSATAISSAIATANITSVPSMLNISGPTYISSSLTASTIVATAVGNYTDGSVEMVVTLL